MEDKELIEAEDTTPAPKPMPPKKKVEETAVSEPEPKSSKPSVPRTTYAVVSGNSKDDVYLSKAVYKNSARKRSLTVHHIQRRLVEWGYYDAYLDKDGFYGDKTKESVISFQDRMGILATGLMDEVTMSKLFEGDTNVIVHLS